MVSGENHPRAGRDYPATWQAFEEWFVDDDACREFLVKVRWPDGFVCPLCGKSESWETSRAMFMCAACGRQTSVTAGTIFHRTRTPLRTWFAAMWFVCAQKTGISATALQTLVGFGSYETAWAWLHKLRRAMVRPDRDRLGGPGVSVELDGTFVGGRQKAGRPRYGNKVRVAIAVERQHPKGLGRVRMRVIDSNAVQPEIEEFAIDVLAPGTILWTDGATHYHRIAKLAGVIHEPISMIASPDPAHNVLPAVHRVASLLKRWLTDTFHNGQAATHLDYYLDEYTFRFNRRKSRSRGLLFYRLCQQAVHTAPHPLKNLTKSDDLS